jgi:FkbM family methyltransferase
MSNPRSYHIRRYGHDFHILVDDEIMETTYKQGDLCEWHMLDWIEKNIPRGGLWIDAGANVGNHSLAFSLWADKVLAFEPMPCNHILLWKNVMGAESTNVQTVRAGVGDREQNVSAELGGTGKNCQWEMRPDKEGEILILTIDSQVEQMPNMDVRLIKLDVEGMEPEAVAGAWGTITKHKPELFIEIWDEYVLAEMTRTLGLIGYRLIERWNVSPTFHFSASGRYPVTYTPAARLRP